MRRLLPLALGAVLLAAVPSQGAGLGADVVVEGEAHFNIYGSDHASYLIDLAARASEAGSRAGASSLTVTVRRCLSAGCPTRMTFVGALPPGAFSVESNLSSGSLSTELFGRRVVLVWDAPESSPLASYEVSAEGPVAGVRLYQVMHAGGLLLSKQCQSKDGVLARWARVDAEPPVTKPLPRAVPRALAGMARGRCTRPVP